MKPSHARYFCLIFVCMCRNMHRRNMHQLLCVGDVFFKNIFSLVSKCANKLLVSECVKLLFSLEIIARCHGIRGVCSPLLMIRGRPSNYGMMIIEITGNENNENTIFFPKRGHTRYIMPVGQHALDKAYLAIKGWSYTSMGICRESLQNPVSINKCF
jgi:hypothetical protein